MNTTYEEIYSRFLSKIEDDTIMQEIVDDVDFAEKMMLGYLKGAISKYIYYTQDYSQRDDIKQTFNITLSEIEKEVLAILMLAEYLSPKILRSETLEQRYGSTDYRLYSPANLLKETRLLRDSIQAEASSLMIIHYYRSHH